ncbi:MAG: response regulator, partial [Chloroflexota bacterium]
MPNLPHFASEDTYATKKVKRVTPNRLEKHTLKDSLLEPKDSTILIVDDESTGRELLDRLLRSEGYQLGFANDGKEALEKANELIPDLILLDVMMPGMDGFEVCRRLRADPVLAEVPIIIITALDQEKDYIEGLELGADDFLTKPFNQVELLARVNTSCAGHGRRRRAARAHPR